MPSNIAPIGGKAANSKIAHMDSSESRMTRAALLKLPVAVQAVREASQRLLSARLRAYFEKADDSLFDLADKATSNEEQNIYFDSMREVRVRRHSIETNFSAAVDEAFGSLLQQNTSVHTDDAYDTLKADALSLVHDDDLEALVAVDSSVARANSEFGEAIQYISLRLDSLVPIKVYQKNNPVGADVVCAAFMAEVKKLDVSIKAKLVLFRLFDKLVITSLGEIYQQINDVLIDNNVMPSLPSHGGRTGRGHTRQQRSPGYTPPAESSVESSVGELDHGVLQDEQSPLSPEVAQTLNRLFGEQTLARRQSDIPPGQLAPEQLVHFLNSAQKGAQEQGRVHSGADVRALISRLRANTEGATIGRTEDQVMNLVNMLFDFILDDRNLPSAMKVLIGRMQIPIIKVALADKSFFTKKGHVARKLLNEMSAAAVGWQGDSASVDRDPLYRKMDLIVRTLIDDFDADVSIFNDLLADFTGFIEKERRRIAILERRTVDAEDGKARAEVARTTIAAELSTRCQGKVLPDEIQALVNDAWNNVLFVNALKHGYESKEWHSLLATLDELIWSVQPPQTAEHRQKLIRTVPVLLKKIRAGLDTISYNPFEMSTLFKSLESVHLRCIRGKLPEAAPQTRFPESEQSQAAVSVPEQVQQPDAEKAKPEPSATVQANAAQPHPELASAEQAKQQVSLDAKPEVQAQSDGQPLSEQAVLAKPEALRVDAPGSESAEVQPPAEFVQQVESFTQGSWFDMKSIEGGLIRCRLAAFIKPTGKYIFVNRSGMKVAEKTQVELALLLSKNALKALDNDMLFDRALETVVSGIRKKRSQ